MTVLFILPKTVSFFFRNKSCSCTTCIVYVNLFKDRFFYVGFLFRKADAKVKTFKYIFQIFSEVFFSSFLFPVISLAKGRTKERLFYRPGFKKKSVNQRCLLFESGCKGKNFISYLPNVFGSFFSFCFFKREFQKETSPKQKKYVRVPTPFLSECQNIAAPVLESGCKSRTL